VGIDHNGVRAAAKSVGWSCDGELLAVADEAGGVQVLDVQSALAPARDVAAINVSHDVAMLEWNPVEPRVLAIATTPGSLVLVFRVSDAGRKALEHVSASATTRPERLELTTTLGNNLNLAWCPDGVHLAVTTSKNSLTVFNTMNKPSQSTMKVINFEDFLTEVRWTQDMTHLVTTGKDFLRLYHWPSLELHSQMPAHSDKIWSVVFAPTWSAARPTAPKRRVFALGSKDGTVSLWTLDGWFCVRALNLWSKPVRALSFSHDGTLLAAAGEHDHVDIIDSRLLRSVYQVPVRSSEYVSSLAWNPTHNFLAFCVEGAPGARVFGFDTPQSSAPPHSFSANANVAAATAAGTQQQQHQQRVGTGITISRVGGGGGTGGKQAAHALPAQRLQRPVQAQAQAQTQIQQKPSQHSGLNVASQQPVASQAQQGQQKRAHGPSASAKRAKVLWTTNS